MLDAPRRRSKTERSSAGWLPAAAVGAATEDCGAVPANSLPRIDGGWGAGCTGVAGRVMAASGWVLNGEAGAAAGFALANAAAAVGADGATGGNPADANVRVDAGAVAAGRLNTDGTAIVGAAT
ncbi:hypothetical protein D0B32_24500 [Paraburkholderia sp. DHOC27]|nr:hypothetical protein D0B32_24500 [Paraburkholderia sp. DHOC27]